MIDFQKQYETAQHFQQEGRLHEAEVAYCNLLKVQPDNVQLLFALANVCYSGDKVTDAIKYLKLACNLLPDDIGVRYSLATLLFQNNNHQAAKEQYTFILDLVPTHIDSLIGLGNIYSEQKKYSDSMQCHEQALDIDCNNIMAHYNLGRTKIKLGYMQEAYDHLNRVLQIDPENIEAKVAQLFILHNLPGITDQEIYNVHAELVSSTPSLSANNAVSSHTLNSQGPIRVGYLSPDFRCHSVAYFIKPILENHNKEKVSTWCYSNVLNPDSMTNTIRDLSDNWRDISNLNDNQVTQLIKNDGIDILVDLAGYTTRNRLAVFALKPAPIQVSWIGYPGTTGLKAIDYRITDERADPVGDADKYHSEKLIRIEPGFLCYEPPGDIPITSIIAARTNGYVTFGSFNNLSKYSDKLIEVWASILHAVPDSRLLLKAEGLGDIAGRNRVHNAFNREGIEPERVECIGFVQGIGSHLKLYNRIDIAFDTFPYNGTTTTCEALWMGVPVITLQGERHASRVGVSILHANGMQDSIAVSVNSYIQLAVNLSNDLEKIERLRNNAREKMRRFGLMNKSQVVSSIEHTYREMISNYSLSQLKNGR